MSSEQVGRSSRRTIKHLGGTQPNLPSVAALFSELFIFSSSSSPPDPASLLLLSLLVLFLLHLTDDYSVEEEEGGGGGDGVGGRGHGLTGKGITSYDNHRWTQTVSQQQVGSWATSSRREEKVFKGTHTHARTPTEAPPPTPLQAAASHSADSVVF